MRLLLRQFCSLFLILALAVGCTCGADDMTSAFGPDCGDAMVEATTSGGGSSVGIAGSSGIVLLSDPALSSIREIVGITNVEGQVDTAPPLTGSTTQLSRPQYLALHSGTNDLIVADQGTVAILFFNDPTNRDGNTPPNRRLLGPATQMVGPVQAYVDVTTDELYVLDRAGNQVLVYASASTIDGDVAPDRRIGGANSGINNPSSFLFRESSGQMIVVNPGELLTFEDYSQANGDPAPIGRVGGGATTFNSLQFAVINASGALFAVDSGTGSLLYFEAFDFDQSGQAPTRTISGGNTGIVNPGQFSLTASDEIYMTAGTEILFFANVSTQEGNIFPTRRFTALNPTLQSLEGLVIP